MNIFKFFKSRKKAQTDKINPQESTSSNNSNPTNTGRKVFEKVIMGAVIGGAIGSVIGASIRNRGQDNKPKKQRFSLLRRLLGIKKKIPIETDKIDL